MSLSPRVLAIDLGRKRVGLALSDPFGDFAVGLDTLVRNAKTDLVTEIESQCVANDVQTVVLGLPVNMDGSEGPKAEESRVLGAKLEKRLEKPVVYVDERLTSVIATQTLQAQGIGSKASRKKGWVDQTAAKLILQTYLDRQNAGYISD